MGTQMLIESWDHWEQALQEIKDHGICGLSIETTGPDPLIQRIRSVHLALPDKRLCFADIFDLDLGEKVLDGLAELLEDLNVKKVIHNANFQLPFIRISRSRRLKFRNIFDLQLASQLCWSGYYDLVPSNSPKNPWKKRVPDHSLEALAERHLGIVLERSCMDWDWGLSNLAAEQVEYSTKRAEMLLPLHRIFQDLIRRNKLERVSELELGTISPMIEMALSGIRFDSDGARALIAKKEIQLMTVFMDIQAEAKANGYCHLPDQDNEASSHLNPDSQKDVKRFLKSQGFDVLSTRADVLHELARRGCRFAEMLQEYRRLSHDLAFLENWLMHLHSTDNRIHSSYFQLRSATGRLSSCRPCAQQIPRKGNDAAAIRKLFSASFGKKIVKADFSAVELRIMAYLSGDQTMIKALQEGQDLHRLTASKISGLAVEPGDGSAEAGG